MDFSSLPQIKIELLGPVNMYIGLGLQVMAAIFLGAAIGINREMKLKSAGFKTHILICLGATLYTSVSLLNYSLSQGVFDPNRVAAQVVSGIGFLGAGAILRSRERIFGLTTAAGIWVVAAIGVAIGSGYIFSATFFTFTILIVLVVLDPLYRILRPESIYHIEVVGSGDIKTPVLALLDDEKFNISDYEVVKDDDKDRCVINLNVKSNMRDLRELVTRIKNIDDVELLNYRLLKQLPHYENS